MNYSMVLKKWDGSLAIDEISFDNIEMWVRVSGIPRSMFTVANGEMIGNMLGKIIRVDIRDSLFSYMRIRVSLPLNRPLKTGFWLERDFTPRKWIDFSYEKLGIFCYACGIIGHDIHDCKSEEVEKVRLKKYFIYGNSIRVWSYVPHEFDKDKFQEKHLFF